MKLAATLFAAMAVLLACSGSPSTSSKTVVVQTGNSETQSSCPPACDCQDFDENNNPGPVYACTCDQDFNCVPVD